MVAVPKKSLGQHWLKDRLILEAIVDCADISPHDTVLEIGPGLGTLTSVLLNRAAMVVAIEFDDDLARKLPGQFPGKKLEVVNADFLSYDLSALPVGYKIVANVPYYITTKIIEHILDSNTLPETIALLVQQEVAEKYAAGPGDMTASAVLLQSSYDVQLCTRVPKMYFTPPPKIDSQVLLCKKQHVDKYANYDKQIFRRIVQAGFSAPRKKLRTSLAGGLGVSTTEVEAWLKSAGIDPNKRAQDLSVKDWMRLV